MPLRKGKTDAVAPSRDGRRPWRAPRSGQMIEPRCACARRRQIGVARRPGMTGRRCARVHRDQMRYECGKRNRRGTIKSSRRERKWQRVTLHGRRNHGIAVDGDAQMHDQGFYGRRSAHASAQSLRSATTTGAISHAGPALRRAPAMRPAARVRKCPHRHAPAASLRACADRRSSARDRRRAGRWRRRMP